QTSDHIEAAAIYRAREVIGTADLIVSVFEPATIKPTAKGIRVLNKADLLSQGSEIDGGVCRTIATSGQGVDILRDHIRAFFGCADLAPNRPRCWADRQRYAPQRDPRDVLIG